MFDQAYWIGVPIEEIEKKNVIQGQMNGLFAYFRKAFCLPEAGDDPDKDHYQCVIDISANSRYRLWVNGVGIQSGPLRSDRYRHFYETIDISAYLHPGENVIAAQVLLADRAYTRQNGFHPEPVFSIDSLPNGHRLAVEGKINIKKIEKARQNSDKAEHNAGRQEKKEKLQIDLTTGLTDWKVYLDTSYYLDMIPVGSDCMGAAIEHIDMAQVPHAYKEAGFDDSGWADAEAIETVKWSAWSQAVGIYQAYDMTERPIPLLYEEEMPLTEELGTDLFSRGTDCVRLAAGSRQHILFALPYVMSAFPTYRFEGGKGAKVTFTYFERFDRKDGAQRTEGSDVAIIRDDWQNGKICEFFTEDTILLDGSRVTYEPFWVRSFRFLQVTVEAGEEEVIWYRPTIHKTGYPLQAQTQVASSVPWVQTLYEMCQHTLEGCMLETYMDCPTWEQFQYPMDTRLQMLFTYVCSTDTKLAGKALEDFHSSQIPDGLILGKAPTGSKQIITTFSLHYIFIIWEYYCRTQDASVLKRYRGDVDDILNYFDDHIGASGLVERLDYWPFVDWQEDWKETAGIPKAYSYGPSTIINLLYAYGLLIGARIMEASGRTYMAEEYRNRQQAICDRVQQLCWDDKREMYREGPTFEQYSQQAQSWAVINGMLGGEQAKRTMTHTFEDEDVLTCYFSTCYELFRACEQAGCYELTQRKLKEWIDLIDLHCTTCPETPVNNRSECHAWSALPMYELVAVIAGIRRSEEDPNTYIVEPHMNGLPDLKGRVMTDKGFITFDYCMEKGEMQYRISAPEGIRLLRK